MSNLDLNRLVITGEVAYPPDMKETSSGKVVGEVKINVGVPSRQDPRSFTIKVVAWEQVADSLRTVVPGDHILVDGKLGVDRWTGKDGTPKEFPRITAGYIAVIGAAQPAPAAAREDTSQYPYGGGDGDIPF